MKQLGPFLEAKSPDLRRAATAVLATFSGDQVIQRLIPVLADSDASVARQADAGLLSQPDRKLVARLLKEAATLSPQTLVRSRAAGTTGKAATIVTIRRLRQGCISHAEVTRILKSNPPHQEFRT